MSESHEERRIHNLDVIIHSTVKNWGIQTRILLLALAPAVVIAVALSIYFVLALLSDLDRNLQEQGLALSRQLAAIAEYNTFSGDRQSLNNVTLAALDEAHVSAVQVYDASGTPLASSGAMPPPLSPLPTLREAFVATSDEEHLLLLAPILQNRHPFLDDPLLGDSSAKAPAPALLGWVAVEVSKQAVRIRKKETITFILALVALTVAGTSLLAMVLVRQVSRPIIRLERGVERIRAGQLDQRLPADSGGDLQRLEEGFNAMALALQDARGNLESKVLAATSELERKRAEAERSSLAKSRFLAAASHDLRQPLHALNLFANDLSNTAASPDQRRLAGQIATSIGAMSELLDSLVSISRLDVAGVHPEMRPAPLQPLFDRLHQAFAQKATAQGLRLRFRPTKAWAQMDPALMERLLSNLLSNAIRYTERGGILVAVRQHGDSLRLEVRDSGSGIAPEHQQAVFEEFFQVGNSQREQSKGPGLGLAIVDRLARAMNTPVSLRSALGRGSVFSLLLAPAQAVSEQIQSTPCVGLLAYGDGFMTTTAAQLQTWLQDWGFHCQRIESPAALTDLQNQGCLVLLGVGNGATLRDTLAAQPEQAGILVSPEEESGSEGKLYLLPHPARPAKLRALLQRLMTENRTPATA